MKLRSRIRTWLLNRQADRLLKRVRREQVRRARVANPGYDELSSPAFLGVVGFAGLVLLIDIPDAWPKVIAMLARVSGA